MPQPNELSDADVGLAPRTPGPQEMSDADVGLAPESESWLSRIPRAFMDRLHAGRMADEAGLAGSSDAYGPARPLFMTDPYEEAAGRIRRRYPQETRPIGLVPYVAKGLAEGLVESLKTLPQRTTEAAGEIQKTGEITEKNVAPSLEAAMLLYGTGTKFGRTVRAPGVEAHDQMIGELPRDADFKTSADLVGKPEVSEQRLRQKWEEEGIHPAEAVNDAKNDAFLRHDLTAPEEGPRMTPAEQQAALTKLERILSGAEEGEIPLRAVGADVTSMPPLVSPAVQPVTPPGRLRAAVQDGLHDLLGLARNIQFMLDPMSTGSPRSMALAKDTANAFRHSDWDWMRRDKEIVDNFKPESRKRMWDAADEESVARQLGESREHQGLVTLEPKERAIVEELHADARETWASMVEHGMVEGEGLPAYTPRMFINTAAGAGEGALPLNSIGRNFFTRTAQMRRRKHMTAEESEAAAKRGFGEEAEIVRDIRVLPMAIARQQKAIAGRELIDHIKEIGKSAGEELVGGADPGRFTLDHPAFKTWRPKFKQMEDGSVKVVKDHGEIVFEQVPIYVSKEFEGPLRAILDEAPSKHPEAVAAMSAYQGLMAIKGKTMTVIMNSPLIHNAVVWGKVAPSAPGQWLGFKLYFTGNKVKNNPQRAGELIDRGLAPMGNRGSFQDISSIMEAPNLEPGRSLTSSFLAETFGRLPQKGMTAEEVMTQIKRDVDKAGDVWHNTLLWDRVADVQFGLADHLSNKLVSLGAERIVADRVASHFSNMIVGSIPQEAMSQGARMFLNTALFSRSFTFGNLQTFKTATVGLPKPLMAQIARDMGMPIEQLSKEMGESGVTDLGRSILKRRAMGNAAKMALGIIAIDYGISKIMNSFIQNGVNVALNDSTWDKEMHGYAERLRDEFNNTKMDPSRLMHPLALVDRMTPMSANEPGKENRIFIGYGKDGTAFYAKNPMGKYPEEMMDWLGIGTDPMDVIRRKLSPTVGGAFEVFANDAGFGRKIRDLSTQTYGGHIKNIIAAVEHIAGRHFPQDQIMGAVDLLRDQGDQKLNALKAFGPVLGFTTSKGAPGGMGKGEIYSEKNSYDARVSIERPAIIKMLKNGDDQGAQRAMDAIGMTPRDQMYLRRSVENPSRISPQMRQKFYQRATPEQIERLERTGQ